MVSADSRKRRTRACLKGVYAADSTEHRQNDAQERTLILLNIELFNRIDPSVIVGHSMGGYLAQKLLESTPVPKVALLATLPGDKLSSTDLAHLRSELPCSHSRAVIDTAMRAAPEVDRAVASRSRFIVIGGDRDRVVPPRWTEATARRYGVPAAILPGGHQLMLGGSATRVASAICS